MGVQPALMTDRQIPPDYYHHFDALRTLAMLYGLLYHAHFLASFPLSEALGDWSRYFRMPAFFFVSAFLNALLLEKRGARSFLRFRMVALLVPLATCYVLVAGPSFWLADIRENGAASRSFLSFMGDFLQRNPLPRLWHLWFLAALALYVLTAPLLAWGRPLIAGLVQWIARRPTTIAILLIGLMLAIGSQMLAVMARWLFPDAAESLLVIRRGAYHYPFYVFGLIAFWHRDRLTSVFRINWPTFALAVALVAFDLLVIGGAGDKWEHDVASGFLTAFVNGIMVIFLVSLCARLFRQRNPLIRFLNESIYSVYLFHILFLELLFFWLVPWDLAPPILFVALVLLSGTASLAVHKLLVERSRWGRFFFNGKRPAAGWRRLVPQRAPVL